MHEWPVADAWKGGHAPARAANVILFFLIGTNLIADILSAEFSKFVFN